jgi:hypothetical protein
MPRSKTAGDPNSRRTTARSRANTPSTPESPRAGADLLLIETMNSSASARRRRPREGRASVWVSFACDDARLLGRAEDALARVVALAPDLVGVNCLPARTIRRSRACRPRGARSPCTQIWRARHAASARARDARGSPRTHAWPARGAHRRRVVRATDRAIAEAIALTQRGSQ